MTEDRIGRPVRYRVPMADNLRGLLVLLFAGSLGLPGSVAAAERPNIVLIMADDLGVEALGCYGGKSTSTPHLDRMAAAGLRFNHAYAQPLCTNTRVELMTGRRATRDWIAFGLLDPQLTTFGHRMQAVGYETGLYGKWQLFSYDPPDYPGADERRSLGMPPGESGFNSWLLFHAGQTEAKGSRYGDPTLTAGGAIVKNAEPITQTFPDKYGPAIVADNAGQFIESADEPFFLYMPLILPHWPMEPPFGTKDFADPTRRHEADVRNFPAMVAAMDRYIGHVLRQLDQHGHGEDTLVLFYSDNGTHQDVASLTDDGWRQGGKGLMTDAGTHVPLIAYWPGTIAAGETDALVSPVDFVPTLMELTGLQPSDGFRGDETDDALALDGVSFLPVLRGEADSVREAVVIDFDPTPGWDKDRFRPQAFARDQRWKLYRDGRLYDLDTDPYEARPIGLDVQTDEQAASRERLRAELPVAD